jgi:S1-C subfamily serine protease
VVGTALVATASRAEAVSPSAAERALSPNRSTITPELFSEIATGVARIRVRGCGGRGVGSGTGFLIGEQVVMTARHVIKGGCSYRVTIDGKSYTAGRVISWYTARTRDLEAADVATLKLSRPAPGHIFSFARRTPHAKTTIAVIGFPLGNPLSFNQGPLVFAQRLEGVPVIGVRIATAKGTSGSAFLDPAGNVVGILQKGLVAGPGEGGIISPSEGIVWGLNLVRWWGPQIVKNLCRAYPQGKIPGCSGAAPANCAASDRSYLNKLSRPYGTYISRWNAWIDSGEPLDESFRPTFNALFALWLNNPDEFACSAGVKKLASLIGALLPVLEQIRPLLDSLAPLPLGDPRRADLETQLDAATSALDVRLQRLEDQLEAVGFFRR